MLKKSQLHDYQRAAVRYIKEKKKCGLFLEMGLGKTAITLTAIEELMFEDFEVRKVLVIAPKQVAIHTWSDEVKSWEHLSKLRVSVAVGTVKERTQALTAPADVYTINRENVCWLIESSGVPFDYDMVVVDELSGFKSPKSKRWKALRKKFAGYKYFVGLTGTPSPNGYTDLWAQCALIDGGRALGRTMTAYHRAYFRPLYGQGYIVYKWGLQRGAGRLIEEKVGTIAMSMQAKDYLTLPPVNYVDVPVYLTDEEMELYKKFERDRIHEFADGEVITADNAAILCGKLLQFCSGCVYGGEDDTTYHSSGISAKYERFGAFLEETSENVLVLYNYRHEFDRLKKLTKGVTLQDGANVFDKWNKGEIPRLLGHPKSMGHGLNLQKGGRIVAWYGLTWSLEEWQQANARLYRQGQEKPVFIYRFYCVGTVEERLIKALDDKGTTQQVLMDAVGFGV